MAVFDIFSKRQKRLRGEVPEIYTCDSIPQHLRVQIVHIIRDAIGIDSYGSKAHNAFLYLHQSLCREYGQFSLGTSGYNESDEESLLKFLLQEETTDRVMDVIEISFQYIDKHIGHDWEYSRHVSVSVTPENAIEELNQRFKEHGIGFQYEGGEIIKVDSTYIHAEIVKPTIDMLRHC